MAAATLTTYLDQIVDLCVAMLNDQAGMLSGDQQNFIAVVQRNSQELDALDVAAMGLVELSNNSHDLRQPLTAMVGYSALLNSPKLSNHKELNAEQLAQINNLHDLARHAHWHLDTMILFANQIVRPRDDQLQDMGMLDLAGYFSAQADSYVCKKHVTDMMIREHLPNVYANDAYTKLMLRALFAVALAICEKPRLWLSAYTVMKVVRLKVTVVGCGDHVRRVLSFSQLNTVMADEDHHPTRVLHIREVDTRKQPSVLQLGMQIATELAVKQGGRVKVSADSKNLVFTLTMPTTVPQARA